LNHNPVIALAWSGFGVPKRVNAAINNVFAVSIA
jgi:hypothetical protein